MDILYINVIEQNAGWGAETFLNNGFQSLGHNVTNLDFRKHRQVLATKLKQVPDFDVLFLQRGDRFPPYLLKACNRPKFFWASELVSRNRDQDILLKSNLFNHIFVHSDECKSRIIQNQWAMRDKLTVMLNGFNPKLHYKMDENGKKKPTYESRWHYTSDRLLHHERTVDITSSVAPENDLENVAIELNKKQDGSEFLELDWSSNETIRFIPTEKVTNNHLMNLPAVCGIAFVKRGYFKMGIVIAHEGYLIDQTDLIHASSEFGKTVNVDFMDYLYRDGKPRFDGIMIYKIEPS